MEICCSLVTQTLASLNQRIPSALPHVLSERRKRQLSLKPSSATLISGVRQLKALSTETTEKAVPEEFSRHVTTGTVVVLFKHDLRVNDHPGLLAAIESKKQILPLYCLDAQLMCSLTWMSGGVSLLGGSLQSLKMALRNLGSDLIFRTGRLSDVLLEVIEETGSDSIVMEAEVDSRWRAEIDRFRSEAPSVIIEEWTSVTTDTESTRVNGQSEGMLDWNTQTLSSVPENIDTGTLPNVNSLQDLLSMTWNKSRTYSPNIADLFGRDQRELWDRWSSMLTSEPHACRRLLRSYLDRSTANGDGNADVDVLNQLIDQTEDSSFPGVSFASLFCSAISLGLLSPKQIHREVKSAQGWRPWRTSFMEAAWRNSLSYDRCMQLHTDILVNGCSGTPGNAEHQLWKWQAMTAEYSIIRPENQSSKGSVVLVHGFGATCMHWRRNVDALSAAGYTVYCPTLPGYGRTQTLYMKYTQAVWRSFLTGFLMEVVGQPAVLAGNSIGAYAAAAVAAEHPDLVEALVLFNPAGPLNEDFVLRDNEEPVLNSKPSAFVVNISSWTLLLYLSISAGRILKKVYPVNKERADVAFLNEILEASKDPNAIAVMKSSFFLKKPTPLNYLLKEMYQKPVLLLQGALDPLGDAEGRAHRIRDMCPNVQVELLQAGHCPHDEAPELVNPRFLAFLHYLHERNN